MRMVSILLIFAILLMGSLFLIPSTTSEFTFAEVIRQAKIYLRFYPATPVDATDPQAMKPVLTRPIPVPSWPSQPNQQTPPRIEVSFDDRLPDERPVVLEVDGQKFRVEMRRRDGQFELAIRPTSEPMLEQDSVVINDAKEFTNSIERTTSAPMPRRLPPEPRRLTNRQDDGTVK